MKYFEKSLLLKKLSAIEDALIEAISEQKSQAKRIMKLEGKNLYEKKWLNMKEAMEYTGLKQSTLQKYAQEKKGERPTFTTRKSGGLKFNTESINDWLQSKERKSKVQLEEYYSKLRVA